MRCMSASSGPSAITSMRCANFRIVVAILLGTTLLHGASGRRVTFRAEDGATLAGAYYEPSRRPAPAIILLHMLRRSPPDWDTAASQLSDAGFAVLALDYRSG